MTQKTAAVWTDVVFKFTTHLAMDHWMVAAVKEGLEFGQQLKLPSNIISPLLLANIFASGEYVRPFEHLR